MPTSASLAQELQKHYSRHGNRVIFSNGMTLNQLALEMWVRSNYSGIDASVLSRILIGQRLFTAPQLETFIQTLAISPADTQLLRSTLSQEILHRFGLPPIQPAFSFDEYIYHVDSTIQKIYHARINGLPEISLEWSNHLYDDIKSKINHIDPVSQKILYRSLSHLLYHRAKAYLGSKDIARLRREGTSKIEELKHVATYLKDINLEGQYYFLIGDYLSITQNYPQASRYLKRSLVKMTSPSSRAAALRIATVVQANLGNQLEFDAIKTQLLQIAPHQPLGMQCFIYNGLAKSEVILRRHHQGIRFISQTSSIMELMQKSSNEYVVDRQLQLTKTQLQSAIALKNNNAASHNSNRLNKLAQDSIILAQTHGYSRYYQEISHLADSLFNLKRPRPLQQSQKASGSGQPHHIIYRYYHHQSQ